MAFASAMSEGFHCPGGNMESNNEIFSFRGIGVTYINGTFIH